MTTDDRNTDAAMVDDDDVNESSIWGLGWPVPDFVGLTRDIQNRVSRGVGSEATEAHRIFELFGREFLLCKEVRPSGGRPWHLLWALYFLKVNPKEGPVCAVVGGPHGGVDPKTHRKWVFTFVEAISELVELVVSSLTM
jgi:hypothetical protein